MSRDRDRSAYSAGLLVRNMAKAPEDLTESGRPRVPRPMPDTSEASHCPHCGSEVGGGHYVCWNCSRDVRMHEKTEDEILTEYQWMVAREELRLEGRNLRFFSALAAIFTAAAVLWALVRPDWGMVVLFGLLALVALHWVQKSVRRAKRIRVANDL